MLQLKEKARSEKVKKYKEELKNDITIGIIEKEQLKQEKIKRKVNLDILKIIACFLVIVNHTITRITLNTNPSIT